MTNHAHLLVTRGLKRSLPLMMLARTSLRAITQRRDRRAGTLWEGCYEASLIQPDARIGCYHE